MNVAASMSAPVAGGAEQLVPQRSGSEPVRTAPASRVALALARLHASRQAIRLELLPPQETTGGDRPGGGPGWLHLWRRLRRWARRSATMAVLVETLEQTWRVHPLRPVGEALADGYRTQVAPVLRKHPWATVALAAGLGAALVASRSWHWPLLSRSLRPLPQRLGRWLVSQLSSAPVQALLVGWLLMNAKSTPPTEPAPVPDPAPAAAADMPTAMP